MGDTEGRRPDGVRLLTSGGGKARSKLNKRRAKETHDDAGSLPDNSLRFLWEKGALATEVGDLAPHMAGDSQGHQNEDTQASTTAPGMRLVTQPGGDHEVDAVQLSFFPVGSKH